MDKQAVEQQLCQLPVSRYAWIDPRKIEFSDRVRYVCKHECPMYGTSWACPPAVGTVESCRNRVLSYPGALVFTSLAEVSDIADMAANACHARRARGAYAAGAGYSAAIFPRRADALHGILCHLHQMRLPGRPLPPPG